MSSECGQFQRTTSNFCIDTHRRALRPKKHLLSFHLNTEHTSLFCVKTRAGIQKTCTDGASSLPPLPYRPFKSNTGLRHRGSWVFPPSHPLMLPLFLSFLLLMPVLGKAGARRQAVQLLQRTDLTLTRPCCG